MANHDLARALNRWIETGIEQTTRLLELLQNEQTTLLSRHALTQLEAVVADKQRLIQRIDAHAGEVECLLRAAHLPPGREGILQLLGRDNEASRERWLDLTRLGEACRRQNRLNGNLVDQGRRFARQTLAVLHGVSPPPELYGPSASESPAPCGRLLATI